jgi:hypothetical protein
MLVQSVSGRLKIISAVSSYTFDVFAQMFVDGDAVDVDAGAAVAVAPTSPKRGLISMTICL